MIAVDHFFKVNKMLDSTQTFEVPNIALAKSGRHFHLESMTEEEANEVYGSFNESHGMHYSKHESDRDEEDE